MRRMAAARRMSGLGGSKGVGEQVGAGSDRGGQERNVDEDWKVAGQGGLPDEVAGAGRVAERFDGDGRADGHADGDARDREKVGQHGGGDVEDEGGGESHGVGGENVRRAAGLRSDVARVAEYAGEEDEGDRDRWTCA